MSLERTDGKVRVYLIVVSLMADNGAIEWWLVGEILVSSGFGGLWCQVGLLEWPGGMWCQMARGLLVLGLVGM